MTITSIPRSDRQRRVFVDTSGFAALFNSGDANHPRARDTWKRLLREKVPVVTSTFVIDETVTLLQRRAGHRIALSFAERALEQAFIPVLEVTEEVLLEALTRFRISPGRDFSFTDCTSFGLMDREGMLSAFAFDDDFSKAGFTLL